jgi:chromosome segregation ATPase
MNYRHKLLNQQNKNQLASLQEQWQQEKTILQQDITNLQNSTDIKLLEQAKEELQNKTKLLDDTINLLGSSDIKNSTDIQNLLAGKTLKELTQYKSLLEQKIKAQDAALINLAKQKIKNQKEAHELLTSLETKWSEKEEGWEQEKKQHKKERDNWASELAKSKEGHSKEINQLKALIKQKDLSLEHSTKNYDKLFEKEKRGQEIIKDLQKDIEREKEELTKSKEVIANLEKEQKELSNQIKTLTENNDKLNKKLDAFTLDKNQQIEQLKQNQQDNLRKINVLFDENALNFETIDFNGLYELLKGVAERERAN